MTLISPEGFISLALCRGVFMYRVGEIQGSAQLWKWGPYPAQALHGLLSQAWASLFNQSGQAEPGRAGPGPAGLLYHLFDLSNIYLDKIILTYQHNLFGSPTVLSRALSFLPLNPNMEQLLNGPKFKVHLRPKAGKARPGQTLGHP